MLIVFMGDLCDLEGFILEKRAEWSEYLAELRDLAPNHTAVATLQHAVKLCERHLQ